jgi:hypothetical protein
MFLYKIKQKKGQKMTTPIGTTTLTVNTDELSAKTGMFVMKLIDEVNRKAGHIEEYDEGLKSFEDYNRHEFNNAFDSLSDIERAEIIGKAKTHLEWIELLNIRLFPPMAYNLLKYLSKR